MNRPIVIAINASGLAGTGPDTHAVPAADPLAPEASGHDADGDGIAEIARLKREIAALTGRQVYADEHARRNLARELHDSVGAELAATRFALANVHTWLPANAAPQCEEALALVARSLDAACEATRHVLDGLHAPQLEAGIVGALSDWTDGFGARTGLRTSFVCAADVRIARMPSAASLALFRIAQEALANVARHACATSADVRLDSTPHYLTLRIADDGIGMPQRVDGRDTHYGVTSMRERCAALGGTLRIAATRRGAGARRGTTVSARFPWHALPGSGTATGARS